MTTLTHAAARFVAAHGHLPDRPAADRLPLACVILLLSERRPGYSAGAQIRIPVPQSIAPVVAALLRLPPAAMDGAFGCTLSLYTPCCRPTPDLGWSMRRDALSWHWVDSFGAVYDLPLPLCLTLADAIDTALAFAPR